MPSSVLLADYTILYYPFLYLYTTLLPMYVCLLSTIIILTLSLSFSHKLTVISFSQSVSPSPWSWLITDGNGSDLDGCKRAVIAITSRVVDSHHNIHTRDYIAEYRVLRRSGLVKPVERTVVNSVEDYNSIVQ